MKVYTKKGDLGKTSILGKEQLDKDNKRIAAYGTIDELNSFVGLLSVHVEDNAYKAELVTIQNELFTLGSELASTPEVFPKLNMPGIDEEAVFRLEESIDRQTNLLPPLNNFVLPGGCEANALAHVCRTVCRRAERQCVRLNRREDIRTEIITYLNRLSDYFFTLARTLSMLDGSPEVIWDPKTG